MPHIGELSKISAPLSKFRSQSINNEPSFKVEKLHMILKKPTLNRHEILENLYKRTIALVHIQKY